MNVSSFSSPERLEDRIAPAGLVTVTFAKGILTISGADGADHDVHVVKTGTNAFRVEGNATGINDIAQTSKNFRGALNHVVIEGGVGADVFEVNLGTLTSLTFAGGAGVDSLKTTNLVTRTGGHVDISLGSETGSVNFTGGKTTIHGALGMDLGGGGSVSFGATTTTVDGNVTITGGLSADAVAITGATTLFKKALTFTAGDGGDSFSASGTTLGVRGLINMDGGAGTDVFAFGAAKQTFGLSTTAVGLVSLKLGEGAGSLTIAGNSTTIYGDLTIDLGSGGGAAHLTSAVTTIRNNVEVSGGAGNDTLEFVGRTTIGKSLSFFGDVGDDALTARGTFLSIKGDTSMDGGAGASTFDLDVTSLALAGLIVRGGSSNDTVSIIADGTISGNVDLQLRLDGTGPSSVILQSKAGLANGLKFGGALSIDMLGATVDVLTIANIQVAKTFYAQAGENVSTVTLSKLNAKGNFTLLTGSGADVVNIDNVNARNFYVDTESGADELRIERNAAFTGTSVILGSTMIRTGIGADQIRIGNASDQANLKVSFMGAMTLDAGDGANMRNDIVASNAFLSLPTIISTGGTLTQTEAV